MNNCLSDRPIANSNRNHSIDDGSMFDADLTREKKKKSYTVQYSRAIGLTKGKLKVSILKSTVLSRLTGGQKRSVGVPSRDRQEKIGNQLLNRSEHWGETKKVAAKDI